MPESLQSNWQGAAASGREITALVHSVAVPLATAVERGMERLLRESSSSPSAGLANPLEGALLILLNTLKRSAGARAATLVLFERESGRTAQAVSTEPARITCSDLCAADAAGCIESQGFGTVLCGNRSDWPARCQGLPAQVEHACCLPLTSKDQLLGMVLLDLGAGTSQLSLERLPSLLAVSRHIAKWVGQLGWGPLPSRTVSFSCI